MVKDKNFNIFNLLMNDQNVNNYTKLVILISQLNHYERYYIPNRIIMNKLKITKACAIRLVNKLKNKNIIKIKYIGNKRHIRINNYDYVANFEPFDDDWFDEAD